MILFDAVKKEFSVRKKKKVTALHDITLSIPDGKTVGIIGASGAGKTTFLKLVGGILQPDAGRVRVFDMDPVRNRKGLRGQIHMLPAEFSNLDTEHTLKENLFLMRNLYRIEGEAFEKRQKEVLQRFSLWDKREENLKQLSLGFRRRAEVAMAFLTPCRIVLLDEPCIGMDEQAKGIFEELVEEEKAKGRTILLSSHDMGEIETLSDRILFLHQGRAVFYGRRELLYRRLSPESRIDVTFEGNFPDLQDIPFIRYQREGQKMSLTYNRNVVTAADIIKGMLQTGKIKEVSVIPPELSDVVTQISKDGGDTSELY